ncbi:dehydrin-like protein 3 [Diplodia corticola]|uniref:Dehydrin-like protein 3 n=1 Tax=Diplodia corticola TaxID=236234 RepID=A0A1J9RQE8_9PEZI|nr:dehydrin-like protein 3 [Diplodia corticola]OJD30124.1 dehydrin-like protein 3 [Diplodia corticola]
MDKLKDIFSPGHKQDADMLYGSQQSADPSSRTSKDGRLSAEGSQSGRSKDNTTEAASSGLPSVSSTKGHGRSDTMDLREAASTAPGTAADRGQGFATESSGPGDSRYGREESAAAATSSLPDRTTGGVHSTPATESETSHRQHNLHPGGVNYAEQRYDSSAAHNPTPTRFSTSSGLEPVGGVSRSSEHGQGIVGAQPTTGNLRPSEFASRDDISVASIRSGVIGDTPHAKELTDSDLPTAKTDHTSSAGRGVGPGAAVAAAGTAAALGSNTERSSDTDRSFPLSGGTYTDTSGARNDYTSPNEPSAIGSASETSTTGMTHGTHGSEEARRAAAAAAGSTPFDMHKHQGNYHEYQGPNTDATKSGPTFSPGPHATEAGNMLDPSLTSSRMPGAYPDSASATPATEEPPSTTTGPSSHGHHYGRDAAIAGAGAATAGGLYEGRSRGTTESDPAREADATHRDSTQDHGRDPATAGAKAAAAGSLYEGRPQDNTGMYPPVEGDRNLQISSQDYGRDPATAGATAAAARSPHGAQSQTASDAPGQEHHYGRDAAIAGAGATAAAGLYETRRKGSTDTDPATLTHGPHKSNVANILDPRVLPDPNKMKGHQAQSTETDPASRTVGPHSSNIANVVDPRVLPQPEKMKQHTTVGPHQSDTLNRMDRKVDSDPSSEANQHHYGRDAAIAGGLGAGAAGAYAASQHQHEKNPYTSQAVDPRIHSSAAGADAPARSSSTKGGWFAGPAGSAVDANKNAPTTSTGTTVSSAAQPGQQHHYGRDAAMAGGAGLAGAGIAHQYGEHKSDRAAPDHVPGTTSTSGPYSSTNTQPTSSIPRATQQPQTTSTTQPTSQHHYGRDAALAGGAGAAGLGVHEHQKREAEKAERQQPYSSADPTRDPASSEQKHHYGRDAAVAGTAGAAGAGAAHEFSKHDAEKAEKEHLKEQKEFEKEQEKEAKKHQKELDKEQAKDDKKYQKELAKDEKKHEKELQHEEKKHEKELEKEEKKKHHGGIFGFLHRDKDKDEDKSSDDEDKRHRHEVEAGAVAAGGAGAAAYEHEEGKHERNRLHKDPPADYVRGHGGEHYGTDGRIGEAGAVSGTHETRPGEYGTARPGDQEGIVIEPHTGLPMNVGKYGSGAGGTDGNETIGGFHSHGAGSGVSGSNVASQGSAHGGNIGPDWDNIKKANTPY